MFFHPSGQSTITAGNPPARVAVSNSALDTALIDENGGAVTLSSISAATSMVVPQGVPGSAQAAASGSGGGPVSIGGPSPTGGGVVAVVSQVVALLVLGVVGVIVVLALGIVA